MNSKMRWNSKLYGSSKLQGLRNERGITALETAIILIAFVVVASVFAFTILSAGTFSTERGKEAIYAGLAEVRGSMELKGSVIAKGTGAAGSREIDQVVFTLASAVGGEPIDMGKVNISFRDDTKIAAVPALTKQNSGTAGYNFLVENSSGNTNLLEANELVQITVDLAAHDITANHTFALEIRPPNGPVILLERTAPAYIDVYNDLK
jgi:archaeal flagellin FlaB